jgi:hypothetical protein
MPRKQRPESDGQLPLAFVQTDVQLSLHLRSLWEDAAHEMGEDRIERAIVRAYREMSSLRRAAARLNFSKSALYEKLVLLKEPRRKRGGSNNPYGRAGKPGRVTWH